MPQQYALHDDPLAKAVLLAIIDPVSQGIGTINSAWVRAADFTAIMATVLTGVLGAAATVNAKLQQAQDAAGTGAADIPGKAIAQIVKATGDNKQAVIAIPRGQLDIHRSNGNPFVRLSITVGGAASLIAGTIHGIQSVYGAQLPAALAASAVEVVS